MRTLILMAGLLALSPNAHAAEIKGDAAAGKKIFRQCTNCHRASEAKNHLAGPNLWGIVGRKRGTIEGFKFSKAMKADNSPWTLKKLDKFLRNPRKVVPGTIMQFKGVKRKRPRQDLIAYLASRKD